MYAWINLVVTKIGYRIRFNKNFYRHKPSHSIEKVSNKILKLESERKGKEWVGTGNTLVNLNSIILCQTLTIKCTYSKLP